MHRVTWSFVLALSGILVGCGASLRTPIRTGPPPILAAEAAERIALGSPDVRPGEDDDAELERLARLALLAERLDQRLTALEAATSAVRLARGLALAHPADDAQRARRVRVESMALALADRLGDAELSIQLAEGNLEAAGQDVITRALAAHGDGPPLSPEVWARLGAAGRMHAEWADRRPLGVAPIGPDDLRSLGRAGAPHVATRLAEAALLGDVALVRALARTLEDVDPLSPLALALGGLMRELDAGTLDDPTLLFCATYVESSQNTGGVVARLVLAREEHPASEALTAALALALTGTGASFDAQALARDTSLRDDRLALLMRGLDALAEAELGDAGPYEALVAAEPGVLESPGWTHLLMQLADEDDFTDPVTRLAARARRATPTFDVRQSYFLAIDEAAPEELRRQALDRLAVHEPGNARMVAGCIAERLDAASCEARLDAMDAFLAGAEDLSIFADMGPAARASLIFDRESEISPELAAAAVGWLDAGADTTHAWDEPWVHARATLAARLGDREGLGRLLAERGAILRPSLLVGARIALAMLEAGEAIDGIYGVPLPTLNDLGAPPRAPTETPPTWGTGCARPGPMTDECARFLSRLEAAAPALAAASIAAYADGAPVDLAALEARAGEPSSSGAVLLRALRAEAAGDHATASGLFLRLALAHPLVARLDRRYLAHAIDGGIDPATALAALSAAQPFSPYGRDVARVAGASPGLDRHTVELLVARDPFAWAQLGELAATDRALVARASNVIATPLREAPDPLTLRARAGALLPLVRTLDTVTNVRLLHAEVALLAGDAAEARAAADRPARDANDSLPLPEVSDTRDVIAAAPLLGPELVVHVLLYRPSGRARTPEALTRFLSPIESAAARDPRLMPFLCGELVRAGDAARAMAACGPLHLASPSPATAFRVAWALTMGVTPAPGIDADRFFETARATTSGITLAGIAWNDALRLAEAGRTEASARAALIGLAHGHAPDGVGNWESDQAVLRGAELRSRGDEAAQNRIYLALAGGEAELADRYGRAALRRLRREPAEVLRESDELRSVCLASDLAAWAAEDARAGRLDVAELASWDRLRRSSFEGEEMDAFAARHPDALVTALGLAVRDSDHGRHREAYEAIQPLLERAPRATLAVVFRRSIGLAASRAEADETVARLRTMYPDDPRLVEEDATASLPAELQSEAALATFLAGLDEAELGRLRPRLRVDPSGHALAAFPANAVPLDTVFGAQSGPVRLLVSAEPRLAHCEGEACLDSMLSSFDAMGMTPIWHAPVDTLAGPGARALIAGPGGAGVFTAVPRGSILYLIGVFGAPEAIAGRLRSYAMLERSFVPLDVVVPSGWAAEIALAGAPPAASTAASTEAAVAEESAMLARHLGSIRAWSTATAEGTGCPIASFLDASFAGDAIGRMQTVLRLYLGEGDATRRVALLRCVDGRTPGGAVLGLAASLDPSAASHGVGAALVAADPAPARALTERLLELDPGRALAGVAHRDSDLPPFAAVELVLALPEAERRTVTAALWARGTAVTRAVAVVVEQMREGSLDHSLVRDTLRTGPAGEAITAADVLYGTLDAEDLAAARARLDALVSPVDEPSRRLALRLVWELARRLDAGDVDRLGRVALRLRETAARAADEEERRLYEWTAEQVEEELAVLRAAQPGGALPEDEAEREAVESSLEVYRGMRRVAERRRTSPRVAQMLATESLARVLPGSHWSYVRVPSPSLLITTLRTMYERLESGSASDGALARQILTSILERSNAALLGPEGGLDLTRPAECATADRFPRAWVCAVYVADRARVEDLLAERRYGTNSGAWLAVEAARQARSLPIAAGGMPYELTSLLEERPPPPSPRVSPVVLRERARTEVDLDGVHVLRYGTFVAREDDDTSVDTEHYLFTGDRLVMFGLEETARAILEAPLPAPRTLAGQPRFRALTEGWTEGAVLQLVNVGFRTRMLPSPLPDGDMGLELSAWDEGLVARIRMPFAEASPSVADLVARLPEGTLSSMAFVPDDDEAEPEPRTEAPAAGEWRSYLLSRATRFALGWYGAHVRAEDARDRVWGSWALALSPTERLLSELGGWSALPEPGRTLERDGLHFGRNGETVVVATSESLLSSALGARPPSAGAGALVGSGRLDGVHTAEVARELASTLRRDDGRREELELLAAILGLAQQIRFEARADPRRRELVLTAHVTPNLGPPGDHHDLIDALLRDARNAVPLPRALTASELRAPVRMVITTSEPDVVATRGFGGSPRVRAEVRDGTLIVTIVPTDATPAALTELERAGLLASTSSVRADAPTIVERARALAPPGTPPAEAARAIVAWVHDHIRYELTADELDAATVLERGRGDCTELARVTTALLRAAQIPAETREGFLVVGAEMGAHAWVAYHDGTTFREIDPTSGRAEVDAGYVPSSVLTLMGLSAIGELRITEVTAAP